MTDAATVSVVVVSRERPRALRRCLLGLSQLRYPVFEIVVVADAAGRSILREMPQAAHIKAIAYDEPNISEARNIGIAHSDGEVIAFIDDDAVPEPSWLTHLAGPFQYQEVAAAGGFVRGRNGISYQWKAQTVDRAGQTRNLEVDPAQPTLLTGNPDQAVKTQGTNMAVRRDVLVELGGFDPNYRFFLDETDLNLRLAARLACTAVVPLAEVHHGFAESARRRADRVPRDLSEIGASWAVFLRRFCQPPEQRAAWNLVLASERRRLVQHMVAGRLEPRDVRGLMRGLRKGYKDGSERRQNLHRPILELGGGFLPYPVNAASSVVLAGRPLQRRALHETALQQVAAGRVVTVMRFSRTARYHKVAFTDQGVWEQTGGLFGKSVRNQPAFRFWRFHNRVEAETDRVHHLRLIPR
ncbi:MAG: glycosyltransferase family 2 protein [Paracoccaceae bacterium]